VASLFQKFLFLLDNRAPRLTRSLVHFRAKFKVLDQLHASYAFLRVKWARHAQVKETVLHLDQWERAFAAYLKQSPRNMTMFQTFMKSGIETIRQNPFPAATDQPILLCVVKNDLERLMMVIEHHRKLGVQRFAILDNGSSDGTLEWLVQQNDIDVFLVKEKFQSLKKYGWINHLLARYGYDRWYVYVDSDELLVYPDCEHKALKALIGDLEQEGQDRMAAIMLDMYSKQEIYSPVDKSLSIKECYPYFDSDSYQLDVSRRGPVIKGGPRKRLFAENQEDSPLLIKFPLFKLKPGMIFESAHYLFPYQLDHKILSALLHYKFLASDLKRHETIARDGNFQGGSREYKRYLNTFQENQHLTFMYNGSVKYENSASLGKIKLGDATPLGLT